jgi:hypothetical protein
MKWILFLIVVNVYDPTDIPGRIQLQFKDQASCKQVLQTMTYWVKFAWFKVEGKCEKNIDSNRQPTRSN